MKKYFTLSLIVLSVLVLIYSLNDSKSRHPENPAQFSENRQAYVEPQKIMTEVSGAAEGAVSYAQSGIEATETEATETEESTQENEPLEALVNELSAYDMGLPEQGAQKAFQLRDFDAFIYQLGGTGMGLAFEQNFRRDLDEVLQSNPGVLAGSLACNDSICATALNYDEATSLEDLTLQVMQAIHQPVSIIFQPVEIYGQKELRILLNYQNSKLLVD